MRHTLNYYYQIAYWWMPNAIWYPMVYSFCFALTVCLLSMAFAPKYITFYKNWSTDRQKLFHTTVVAFVMPCIITAFIFPEFIYWLKYFNNSSWLDNPNIWEQPTTMILARVLGISLGYLVFDTCAMLVWFRELKTAMRPALFFQMMFHHIASICVWSYCVKYDRATFYVFYCIFTEVTNIFLNFRSILAFLDLEDVSLHTLVGTLLLVVFTIVRILPIPWIISLAVNAYYGNFNTLQIILGCVFGPAPILLNIFWYFLLVRKAVRMLKADPNMGFKKVMSHGDTKIATTELSLINHDEHRNRFVE